MIHICPNKVGLETRVDGVGIVEVTVWGRGKIDGDWVVDKGVWLE